MMEAAIFSETSVSIYQTTRRNIPETAIFILFAMRTWKLRNLILKVMTELCVCVENPMLRCNTAMGPLPVLHHTVLAVNACTYGGFMSQVISFPVRRYIYIINERKCRTFYDIERIVYGVGYSVIYNKTSFKYDLFLFINLIKCTYMIHSVNEIIFTNYYFSSFSD
jgi:hypothetical protein